MPVLSPRATRTCLLSLLFAANAASAGPASFTPSKGQLLCGSDGKQAATWSGACVDGLASGAGVATWTDGTTPNKLEATLVRGEASGSATLVFGETTYIGTLRQFAPQGQGFFKYRDGSMYEGGIDNGKYAGAGVFQAADRSRYEGEWVAGRREGMGRATFALGGSYDGHWRHGRFDGAGTIVYAGGRSFTGQFQAGRLAGAAPLPALDKQTYRISDTSAGLGTFIPNNTATSNVSGGRWMELSDNERRIVKADYMALEEGDEPPYPADGWRPVFASITKVNRVYPNFTGPVRMHVLVGADGKPKSVSAIGKLPPEVVRYIGGVLMLTMYKPAVCHGAPCEMLLPLAFNFETKL